MMVQLKNLLRTCLRSRGLDLVRVNSGSDDEVPPTEFIADHVFSVGHKDAAALSVPVTELTWDNGFSLDPVGWNPYRKTACEYLDGSAVRYETSSLHAFYAAFIPASAAEYLAPVLPADGPLSRYPAASYILPWSLSSPGERLESRARQNHEEERLASSPFKSRKNMSGFNKMGPVSADKGRLEFQRLTTLADSIRLKGYRRHGIMDVEAVALHHRGERRFVVASGFHRSAVLAALGYERIRVVLKPRLIVDMDILLNGPAVRKGYWNSDEVSLYLDYLFAERGLDRARALGVA
jgi:hypothetical protein